MKSLRKFAELGLAIYLDNKKINIFEPNSNKTFISGVYKKLYWIIELEINKSSSEIINRQVFANLTNIEPQVRTYFTRSTAIKEKEMTDEKNEIEEGKTDEPESKIKDDNKIISEIKSKSDEYRQEKDFV